MRSLFLTLSLLFTLSLLSQNYYVNEDFNSGSLPSGWTNTAVSGSQAWSFGIDGVTNNYPQITNGINNIDGTPLAYFDDDVLGQNFLNNFARLSSPTFDNSNDSISVLEFDFNFKEGSANDSFYVEVFNGRNWVKVFSRITDDCGNYSIPNHQFPCDNEYPHSRIDISAYKNPNCQVRFVYYDGYDWAWYAGIDNVEIYSPYQHDLTVISKIAPRDMCSLSNQDSVTLLVHNLGVNSVSNFSVGYQLNGFPPVIETITDTLAYLDTLVYTFNTTANFSVVTTHNLSLFTTLSQEQNLLNDTLQTTVINYPVLSLPYQEDFETANHGWKVSGRYSSWERGIPNNTLIDTAASGQNAFVTSLDNSFNKNETSYITSPCFDFSQYSGIPLLSFNLFYDSRINHDSTWIEYSLNKGNSWEKLYAGSYVQNWYNNANNGSWGGSSNQWLEVFNSLDSLVGEPMVKFRLAFKSKGRNIREGIGFDNFNISTAKQNDLLLAGLKAPSINQAPICGYSSNLYPEVEIKNLSLINNQNFSLSYQIDGGRVFTDSISTQIAQFKSTTHTFSFSYDFSHPKTYVIKVWLTTATDTFYHNDTLNVILNNNAQKPLNILYEDFEKIQGNINHSDWSIDPVHNGTNIAWLADSGSTPTSRSPLGATGPSFDHTLGNIMGTYVYLEASGNTKEASFTSRCIDLHGSYNPSLLFWYHMFGSQMGDLYVDIYDSKNNIWINKFDSLVGQSHSSSSMPWLEKKISLSQFANEVMKVRFRGTLSAASTGIYNSDMAIDDIRILLHDYDLSLNKLITPIENCELTTSTKVSIELKNNGHSAIKADSAIIYYQINNGIIVHDTLKQNIGRHDSTIFTFSQNADLSKIDSIMNLKLWIDLNNDRVSKNDTLMNSFKVYSPNLFEDFEVYNTPIEISQTHSLWTSEAQTYTNLWTVDSRSPLANITGPTLDHTYGVVDSGNFVYKIQGIPQEIKLNSPCIALDSSNHASLSFWYHKYGNQMDDLFINLKNYSKDTLIKLDSIKGQTQNSSTAPWLNKTIDLSPYLGDRVKVIFNLFNNADVIALDDISIYDSTLTVNLINNLRATETQLTLYPNPSYGEYYIESSENLSGFEYQILDLHGRTVQRSVIKAKQTNFDLSNNAEGIYFLVIPELNVKEKLVKY